MSKYFNQKWIWSRNSIWKIRMSVELWTHSVSTSYTVLFQNLVLKCFTVCSNKYWNITEIQSRNKHTFLKSCSHSCFAVVCKQNWVEDEVGPWVFFFLNKIYFNLEHLSIFLLTLQSWKYCFGTAGGVANSRRWKCETKGGEELVF